MISLYYRGLHGMDVFKGLSLVALTGSGGMLETEWVP